jgi:hypothetical protein
VKIKVITGVRVEVLVNTEELGIVCVVSNWRETAGSV